MNDLLILALEPFNHLIFAFPVGLVEDLMMNGGDEMEQLHPRP
jgi:hypothetical protein